MFGFGKNESADKKAQAVFDMVNAEFNAMGKMEAVDEASTAARNTMLEAVAKYAETIDALGASAPTLAVSVFRLTATTLACVGRTFGVQKDLATQILSEAMDAVEAACEGGTK